MKTGVLFGEFISTGKPSKRRNFFSENSANTRDYLLLPLLIICVGLLIFKLMSLQVFNGSYYRGLSDNNRIRTAVIHAPRGIIFDRNGTPLVYNTPGFRQAVDGKTHLISREKAIDLIAHGEKGIEVDALRQYPMKDAVSHILGYIGQISKEELQSPAYAAYQSGDLVGKMGIEQEYENKLRGIDGHTLVEVDSMGKTVRTLGQTDSIPGQDITLTIDAKMQQAAYEAMSSVKKGVLIVSTPKGEVLAMVSKPSFDPNLFTLGEGYSTATSSGYQSVEQILTDGDGQPLLNRAIGGTYPPGSTFKLVTAASGLENKKIDENYQINDTGVVIIGAFSFANWYYTQYGKTEGEVNVVKAIKRSNDVFFYKLAELVGVDNLSQTAMQFGLGKTLGIDLAGERSGLVPTQEWKKKVIGEPWYLGDTYHYGIGQGYLLVTPLQVNAWTQEIANGGPLYRMHLLASQPNEVQSTVPLDRKTISLINTGMEQACSPGGVAWPLFDFSVKNAHLPIDSKNFFAVPQSTSSAQFADYRHVSVGCKTGTAQHGDDATLPHAWITLFAPIENPQIVVTVLSESSGEGSNVAAPVAKKVLDEWFMR